jgi:SfnB family sulfur acquisition oxidoreductase
MIVDSPTARILRNDADAIAAAHELAARLRPGAVARDQTRAVPEAELRDLAASGLLAITLPATHGGADVSFQTLAEVFMILAAADSAVTQVPQNHFVFVDVLCNEASPAQQAFFFPKILAGARLGNALSERGGSVTGRRTTRLLPTEDGGYRLNGRKYYCTGALTAQWIPVMASDEHDRNVIAYVPRHAPGVEATDDWTAMGQRATISGTVILTDVAVPAENVVPHWQRYESPHIFGATAQLIHAAIHVGIGIGALADGVAFLRDHARAYIDAKVERAREEPYLLRQVGEMSARIHAAEALVLKSARVLDQAKANLTTDTAAAASIAVAEGKAFAGEVAVQLASDIFTLAGASATDARHDLDRHWRNARTHTLHDPARWKYHHVGNFIVNGQRPPSSGVI